MAHPKTPLFHHGDRTQTKSLGTKQARDQPYPTPHHLPTRSLCQQGPNMVFGAYLGHFRVGSAQFSLCVATGSDSLAFGFLTKPG